MTSRERANLFSSIDAPSRNGSSPGAEPAVHPMHHVRARQQRNVGAKRRSYSSFSQSFSILPTTVPVPLLPQNHPHLLARNLEIDHQEAQEEDSLPEEQQQQQQPPKKRRRKSPPKGKPPSKTAADTSTPPAAAASPTGDQEQPGGKASSAVDGSLTPAVGDKSRSPSSPQQPKCFSPKTVEVPPAEAAATGAGADAASPDHDSPPGSMDTVHAAPVAAAAPAPSPVVAAAPAPSPVEPPAPAAADAPPAGTGTGPAESASSVEASVEVKGTDLLWPPTPMEMADVFQVLASHPRLPTGGSGSGGGGGGRGGQGGRPVLTVIDPAMAATRSSPVGKKRKQQRQRQQQQQQQQDDKSAKTDSTAAGGGGGGAPQLADQGMSLLAAVAVGRALEEAQQHRQKAGPASSAPRSVGGVAGTAGPAVSYPPLANGEERSRMHPFSVIE